MGDSTVALADKPHWHVLMGTPTTAFAGVKCETITEAASIFGWFSQHVFRGATWQRMIDEAHEEISQGEFFTWRAERMGMSVILTPCVETDCWHAMDN